MLMRSWVGLVVRRLFGTFSGANRQSRRRRRSVRREFQVAALEKRTLLSGTPQFSADAYEIEGVDRHIGQGTVVGSVSASGGEGSLYYSGGDSTFSVNYDGSIVFNGSSLSAGTTYSFSVSVYDTEYGSDYATVEITTIPNNSPEFSSPENPDRYVIGGIDRHITQGTVVGQVSATDPDGDPLYYSGGDSMFTINYDGSIVFSGSSLSPGTTYTFTASVYDDAYGSDYATVEITTIPNNSPEFSSPENPDRYVIGGIDRHITQGTVVGQVSATDPDGDPLYYSGGDSMFTINYDGSIVFSGSSLSPGTTYTFTASVYDDAYGSDYATVEITTIPNNAPEFNSPVNPDRYNFSVSGNIAQGTVIGQVSATDADGDPIYYSGGDSNFSVQYDGSVVFTGYGLSSNTTYTLFASAYDDAYGSDYAEIVITTGQMGSGSQSGGGSQTGSESGMGSHSGTGSQSGTGSESGTGSQSGTGSESGNSHTDDSGSGGSHTDDSTSGGESDTGHSDTGGSSSGGEDSTSGGSHTEHSTSGGDSYSYGSDSGDSISEGSGSGESSTGGSEEVDAVDDEYEITSGTAAGNVSENDTGASQFWVTIEAEHGTVSMGADGTFTYTADAGWTGGDQFQYMAYAGEGESDTATVTLNGGGGMSYVIANDDTVNLQNGTASGSVGVNDIGATTFTLLTDASHGTLTLLPDGSYSYLADEGWTGGDSFEYIAYGANGHSDTATVTINGGGGTGTETEHPPEFLMVGESDPQVPTNDTFVFTIDEGWTGTVGSLTAIDPEMDQLTFIAGPPSPFSLDSWGRVAAESAAQVGTYSFMATVSDGRGGTDTATVTIIVREVNHAPEFLSWQESDPAIKTTDTFTFVLDEGNTGEVGQILAGDAEQDQYIITAENIPFPFEIDANGMISIAPGASATYGISGHYTFEVKVTGLTGHPGPDFATVSIIVNGENKPAEFLMDGENDPGVLTDDTFNFHIKNHSKLLDPWPVPIATLNAGDFENDPFTYSATDLPEWLELDSTTGEFRVVEVYADAVEDGLYTFEVGITGGDTATVNLEILHNYRPEFLSGDEADPKVATTDRFEFVVGTEDVGSIGYVTAKDEEGDRFEYLAVTTLPDFLELNQTTGQLTIKPNVPIQYGTHAFVVQAYGVRGGSNDTATVSIEVNQPPEFLMYADYAATPPRPAEVDPSIRTDDIFRFDIYSNHTGTVGYLRAGDLEDDPYVITSDSVPPEFVVHSNGRIQVVEGALLQSKPYVFQVLITGKGGTDVAFVRINVTNIVRVGVGGDTTGIEGSSSDQLAVRFVRYSADSTKPLDLSQPLTVYFRLGNGTLDVAADLDQASASALNVGMIVIGAGESEAILYLNSISDTERDEGVDQRDLIIKESETGSYDIVSEDGKPSLGVTHLVWLRVIDGVELFVKGNDDNAPVAPNDVDQQGLGDCFFMAALLKLAEKRPGWPGQHINKSVDWTLEQLKYDVKFYSSPGVTFTVPVTFDMTQGFFQAGFGDSPDIVDGRVEIWPLVYEMAYAQALLGYGNITSGSSSSAWKTLTGQGAVPVEVSGKSDQHIRTIIDNALSAGKEVILGTMTAAQSLPDNHSITITGVNEDMTGYLYGNPWGSTGTVPFDQLDENIDVVHILDNE